MALKLTLADQVLINVAAVLSCQRILDADAAREEEQMLGLARDVLPFVTLTHEGLDRLARQIAVFHDAGASHAARATARLQLAVALGPILRWRTGLAYDAFRNRPTEGSPA